MQNKGRNEFVFHEQIHIFSHDAVNFNKYGTVGDKNALHFGNYVLKGIAENGMEQFLLVTEVIVQQRLVYSCLIGYLLHAGTFQSMDDKHFFRGIENLILGG
jgi:hypothetical protein